tara:strand:- start:6 stop:281 length:276 start_codon:yes stop_codon:yes gene_type:complete
MSNPNQPSFVLTNAKLAMSIAVPFIAVVGFFFSLKAATEYNNERIATNIIELDRLEARMERLDDMMVENNTNIKLMQKDITIIIEQMKGSK